MLRHFFFIRILKIFQSSVINDSRLSQWSIEELSKPTSGRKNSLTNAGNKTPFIICCSHPVEERAGKGWQMGTVSRKMGHSIIYEQLGKLF